MHTHARATGDACARALVALIVKVGLEALEGLERAESFRSDSMSSDISDGAADRAKGMIDPDDQFYAGAKAAYENTMNAPGGKCLKSE